MGKDVLGYSDDFKRVIIDKLIAGTASSVEIGRELSLPPQLIRRWFREAQERSRAEAAALAAKLPTEAELLPYRPPVFLIDEMTNPGATEAKEMATPKTAVTKEFTPEFKEAAVKKVKAAGGIATRALADEIGVTRGTLRAWLNGKGLDTRRRRQFDEKFKQKIVARVKAGETIHSLAPKLGIVHSVIDRWVEKAAKPSQAKKTKGPFRYSDEIKERALALMEELDDANAVAKKMKFNVGTLYKWLRDARPAQAKANGHVQLKSNGEGKHVKDAILYLKHATAALEQERDAGKHKERFRSHLLMELAYKELTGE